MQHKRHYKPRNSYQAHRPIQRVKTPQNAIQEATGLYMDATSNQQTFTGALCTALCVLSLHKSSSKLPLLNPGSQRYFHELIVDFATPTRLAISRCVSPDLSRSVTIRNQST